MSDDEMSDSEMWAEMWKQKQQRGKSLRDAAPEELKKNEIKFTVNNNGVHLIVQRKTDESQFIDFWPGTRKWNSRNGRMGHGIEALIKYCLAPPRREESHGVKPMKTRTPLEEAADPNTDFPF